MTVIFMIVRDILYRLFLNHEKGHYYRFFNLLLDYEELFTAKIKKSKLVKGSTDLKILANNCAIR